MSSKWSSVTIILIGLYKFSSYHGTFHCRGQMGRFFAVNVFFLVPNFSWIWYNAIHCWYLCLSVCENTRILFWSWIFHRQWTIVKNVFAIVKRVWPNKNIPDQKLRKKIPALIDGGLHTRVFFLNQRQSWSCTTYLFYLIHLDIVLLDEADSNILWHRELHWDSTEVSLIYCNHPYKICTFHTSCCPFAKQSHKKAPAWI